MAKTTRYPRSPILKVKVTKEIVARGEIKNSGFCANAEAVKAAFQDHTGREARHVSVDIQSIRLTDPVKRLRYIWMTPGVAQNVVINNDQGIHSDPIDYTLRGAHVVKMPNAPRRTKGQKKPNYKMPTKKAVLRGAKLRTASGKGGKHRMDVPELVGGAEPPVSILEGRAPDSQQERTSNKRFQAGLNVQYSRRREFGRRLMKAGPRLSGSA